MSGTGRAKKSRPARPSKSKGPGLNQNHPYTGSYGNPRLVHVLLSLVGKKCQTTVRNGGVYEGVFHTFSPKMDVSLDAVHKCDASDSFSAFTNGDVRLIDSPKEQELIDQMVFYSDKLVSVTFEDVDLAYAELEYNETNGDSANVPRASTKGSEKKLEPWNGGGDAVEDEDGLAIGGLEDSVTDGTNGWAAAEMFRANEEKYGVKSDYDASLSNYTMALDIKDTDEDSERVARATRMAQEIESGSDYKQRADLELDDGVTEEDKFSAVTRDRDIRRDSRDSRDQREREMRDREHRDYRDREKDRGDLRERERENPHSPPGFKNKHEFERFHQPRNRGRGRDSWEKRNQGYPNMGPARSMGLSGPSSAPNRNAPMSQMDVPPNQSGMNKYRPTHSQTSVAPRFAKSGSGGHGSGSAQRDEERIRQHNDANPMHHGYQQAPKSQRQQRVARPNQHGLGRGWGLASPASEYPQHSPPAQMHQDPAVISVSPAGAGGPPSLSRTSSSSSNTSAPAQGINHRKLPSSSSQDDQQQISHHPHSRQQVTSSSPTTGPPPNANQRPMSRPQNAQPTATNPPTLSGKDTSWSSIVSGNPKGPVEMAQPLVHPPQHTGVPQQSAGSRIQCVSVQQHHTYTYIPKGATPPTSNMPGYPPRNLQMAQLPPSMGSSQIQQRLHHMQPAGEHGVPYVQTQMMTRQPPPPQGVVTSPPQQQIPHPISAQPSPRVTKMGPVAKLPISSPPEPARHQPGKNEDENKQSAKKSLEPPSPQANSSGGIKNRNGSPSLTELKTFGKNFKLQTDVTKMKETAAQPPGSSPPTKAPPRQPAPHATTPLSRAPAPQPFPTAMAHGDRPAPQHGMAQPGNQMPNTMTQQSKSMQQPSPAIGQMHHQQANYQQQIPHQIPMAAANIQHFGSVPSAHPQVAQNVIKSPRVPEGVQQAMARSLAQTDKGVLTPQQKPMTSPKQEMPNIQLANVHVVTGHIPQANPTAVITVSAAAGSPIVSSSFPSPSAAQVMQAPRHSPTGAPASSSAEIKVTSRPISQAGNGPSVTSPTTTAKALNPEAQEFKPRTPAKPTSISSRATTPQTSMQPLYPQVPQMAPQTPGQLTPVYNTGQMTPSPIYNKHGQQQVQIDHMSIQAHPMGQQMYQTHFQQQFILQPQPAAQHVVQQMPGQQQFAAFDQTQVYTAPQTAMMPQNARVALPGTPQSHMQTYQPDQTGGPMYVPVPAPQGAQMQANFMQQARPHSAHTPTQAPHVTAASPANPSGQQVQPSSLPQQGMVQQGGAVPLWMSSSFVMVQGTPAPGQHLQHASGMAVNQAPQPQYVNTMQPQIPSTVAITGVTAQQKGQTQAIAAAQYITHQPQYPAQTYQPTPSNQ